MNPKMNRGGVLGRVIRYMLHYYKYLFALVIVCILVSAVATVIGATFPQTLVDDYIEPMLANGSADFSGLGGELIRLVCIMAVGIVAAFGYNRIMVNVSQGTLRHLRDDLFSKMEALPIKYFDQNNHGDIMSHYTNDIDTLRQMISQSFPQLLTTVITSLTVFCIMIYYSVWLALVVVAGVAVMLLITKKIGGSSARHLSGSSRLWVRKRAYRGNDQRPKGGQGFCHEEESKADFDKINDCCLRSRKQQINTPIRWARF